MDKRNGKKENMISPFEPNQIKELYGNKVISYGTVMDMMLDAQVDLKFLQI